MHQKIPGSQRGSILLVLLFVFGILILAAGLIYWRTSQKSLEQPQGQICIQDAKQCPDGSYVSRTGPKCEFAQCPATSSAVIKNNNTTNLSMESGDVKKKMGFYKDKVYTDDQVKFSFQYPGDLEIDEEEGYLYPVDGSRAINTELGSINVTPASQDLNACNVRYDFNNDPEVQSRKNITKDGVSILEESLKGLYLGDDGEGYGNLYIDSFCFIRKGKSFTFSLFAYNDPDPAINTSLEKIMNSLKFSDK